MGHFWKEIVLVLGGCLKISRCEENFLFFQYIESASCSVSLRQGIIIKACLLIGRLNQMERKECQRKIIHRCSKKVFSDLVISLPLPWLCPNLTSLLWWKICRECVSNFDTFDTAQVSYVRHFLTAIEFFCISASLFSLFSETESLCMKYGSCENRFDSDPYDLDFYRTWWGLTKIPTDIPSKAKNILLDHNQITSLSIRDFPTFHYATLHLSSNLISTIEPGTFQRASSLIRLWLDGNKLTTIPPKTFQGLESLETLSLERNQISSLAENSFSGLQSLLYLDLDENQLSHLNKYSFTGLYSLQELSLVLNNFTTLNLEPFTSLPRPLHLLLAKTKAQWNCNSLCWLKIEVRFQTVSWDSRFKTFYTQKHYPPQCSDWDTLHCDDNGLYFETFWCVLFHFLSCMFASLQMRLSQVSVWIGDCPEPGGIAQAVRFGNTAPYHTGDQVVYACNQGYTGGGPIWCQPDGTWTAQRNCMSQLHSMYMIHPL